MSGIQTRVPGLFFSTGPPRLWYYMFLVTHPALQKQNTEISKQIFPEKYRGLSPNFHIHASVNDLYIPTIGLPFLLEEICRPILGLYINRSQTHECGIWSWGRAIPRKGIHKRDFRCSALIAASLILGDINNIYCRENPAHRPSYGRVFFHWTTEAMKYNIPRPAHRNDI